jgi:hypothetical protein
MVKSNLMSTTRLLTLLLIGTLAATGTQAQSISQSDHGQQRQDSRSDEHSKRARPWGIVGSWFGTTTTGFKQLITFHADGTVMRSVPGEVSVDPARPPHTPAHGVWRYLGRERFGVTMWDIFYDVNTGQLRHYMRIRYEVTIDRDGDTASVTAVLEVIDPQGVVTQTRTGAATLARIQFEPIE